MRNKASARKSRDQDKERLKQMETDFLTKAVSCLAEVLCKSPSGPFAKDVASSTPWYPSPCYSPMERKIDRPPSAHSHHVSRSQADVAMKNFHQTNKQTPCVRIADSSNVFCRLLPPTHPFACFAHPSLQSVRIKAEIEEKLTRVEALEVLVIMHTRSTQLNVPTDAGGICRYAIKPWRVHTVGVI